MKFITILLLLFPAISIADYGFTYKGDINGDNLEDYIYSGSSSLFGNGGGPCLIKVSTIKGYKEKVVHCNRSGIFLDPANEYKPARIWGYSRMSAGTGGLYTLTLDGEFTEEGIFLYPGVTGDSESIGSLILKIINEHGQWIEFEHIENNYLPPELSCGRTWAKGC